MNKHLKIIIFKKMNFLNISDRYLRNKGYTEQKIDRRGFEILNEIKGSIRQSEQVFRIRKFFLDMPFYRRGKKKKRYIQK